MRDTHTNTHKHTQTHTNTQKHSPHLVEWDIIEDSEQRWGVVNAAATVLHLLDRVV